MFSGGSVSGAPAFRSSESSFRRRKSSLSEPLVRANNELPGNDLLLDPLVVGQAVHLGNHADSPIDNVRRVLGGREHLPATPMLTEMMRLVDGGEGARNRYYWEQCSRWIKYEQVVEGDMTRFSKPHITLLSLPGLLQLRNCLKRGTVLLDVETHGSERIFEVIVDTWREKYQFNMRTKHQILTILKAPKYHLGGTAGVNVYNQIDSSSASKSDRPLVAKLSREEKKKISLGNGEKKEAEATESASDEEDDDEVFTVGVAPLDSEAKRYGGIAKVVRANQRLLRKLPDETLSSTILHGVLPHLDRPLAALVRLSSAQGLHPEIPDIPLPTKFIFVLLTPRENYPGEVEAIGRTMGALLADEIWRKAALYSNEPHTISDAIEEFFSQIVVIPPGKCDTSTRWEPKEGTVKRDVGMLYTPLHLPFDDKDDDVFDESSEGSGEIKAKDDGDHHAGSGHHSHHPAIVRTGRLFGGLFDDVKRKLPLFASDFTDFYRGRLSQSLAATMFIFFANITSIITFGAVMERALHHQMAAVEAILCGGISGVVFALFSGQPLNILSATGPTLVFEKILFEFCVGLGWQFLPFRFWVGVWIAVFLVLLVATDMSALVGLITRFTEEAFATLISVVFIVQAFQKLLEVSHDAPLFPDPREVISSPCFCHINITDARNFTSLKKQPDVTAEECELKGGVAVGLQCHFKPDVYMLSVLLTFGTFTLAYLLNKFRKSPFFSSSIRNSISDFGVLIAIITMTCFSHFIGLDVPVLHVPESFRPSINRSWLVEPYSIPWHVALFASLPAAFYTILIVMDQQITAVIINRKDNKLKKGGGYHLDLLVIAALVLLCSALGLPFYVAATVLSVMHVDSLRVYSESSAPGEVPTFLGVNEQRVTAILAHILIGLSVFLTPIIKLVPLPVLIGIFLYMGVVSLFGQQFVQRIALFLMPDKHQPDYIWLRLVRMRRVHLFTIVQVFAMAALFAVKYMKAVSMMFPLMLVFMVLIRMFILSRMFTKAELAAIDDPLPTFAEIMSPKKKDKNSKKCDDSELERLDGKGSNHSKVIFA